MFDAIDDTIVAVSSPPGFGVRGIVRCSGPRAIRLAADLFKPDGPVDIESLGGFRRAAGEFEIEPNCLVPGELYLFRGPRSYTRQDCVEFHVPGAPALLAMLVRSCIRRGARAAAAGEFTARAFLCGGMDLTRAEAVAAVIKAHSDVQLRAAHRMMDGRLAARTAALLDRLAELMALVEADIDFAEEPIEFITPNELKARLTELDREFGELIEAAESSERLNVLPQILLIGRPNAGKSTLMNRLSGIDRSICSPVSGTTRDLLSAPVRLGHREAVLLDAAGVDSDLHDLNRVAADATMMAATRVDVLCLVVDLSADQFESALSLAEVATEVPCVLVANKIDLLDINTRDRRLARISACAASSNRRACPISASTGEGLDRCREMLAAALDSPAVGVGEDTLILTARQREAVQSARQAVARCIGETSGIGATIDRADILAFELREALDALSAVTGAVTTEDLLTRVFANFCIGK